MTDAEKFAKAFNFFGKSEHGMEMDDFFFEDGGFQFGNDTFGDIIACPSRDDVMRWEFNDGSSLVIFGEEWGFGWTREELESDHVKKLFADTTAHPLPAAFSCRETVI